MKRLVIVGGGVAALEATLALREFAADQVEIELHAPGRDFAYRPLSVGKPFGAGRIVNFDLDELALRLGAAFFRDCIVSVDPVNRHVLTHEGEQVPYDYLLFCPGAEPHAAVPGTSTFWGIDLESGVAKVVRELREGTLRRVTFAIPGAVSWSLPIYELALMAHAGLSRGVVADTRLSVVTPERLPLEVFGERVADHVRDLLADRGIELITGAHPVAFEDGFLHIAGREAIEAEAAISAPRLEGHRVAGIPCDEYGFVDVDEHNRVAGLERIYAAGDVTSSRSSREGSPLSKPMPWQKTSPLTWAFAARPERSIRFSAPCSGRVPSLSTCTRCSQAATAKPLSSAKSHSGSGRERSSASSWHPF